MIDRRSGDVVAERRFSEGASTAIAFTADGDRLLVGHREGSLVVLDGDSLEPIGSPVDLGRQIFSVYPAVDGQRAAADG